MNKPYNKEMWEQEKIEARRELLRSTEYTDEKMKKSFIINTIITIIVLILVAYIPIFVHNMDVKKKYVSEEEKQAEIKNFVNNIVTYNYKMFSEKETMVYMADLYNYKYNAAIPMKYYDEKDNHQCMGYIIVTNNSQSYDIDVSHYCDMFE